MTVLPGYLEISDPVNGDVVLVDSFTTATLVAGSGNPFEVERDCDGCVCESASCCRESIEEMPWFTATNPASSEFLGLSGYFRIDQPAAASVLSQSGSTVVAPLKQLVFSGVLWGTTARGVCYGSQWVSDQLEPLCRSCDGRTATIYKWCASSLCDDVNGLPGGSDPACLEPVVPVVWDHDAVVGVADQCVDPVPLPPNTVPPLVCDDGERTLLRVSYVPGSFQTVDDDIPPCWGRRVTFAFTVDSGESLGPVQQIVTSTAPVVQPCCASLRFDMSDDPLGCGCSVACSCVDVVVPLRRGFNPPPFGSGECGYSTPWCSKSFAQLVGPVAGNRAVPTIEVRAGAQALENVSVTIWRAVTGFPSPATPRGLELYDSREPVTEPALVPYIGPYSTLVLDGGDQREYVRCSNQSIETADVTRCGEAPYRHPEFCCGARYWVVFELPCWDHDGDGDIDCPDWDVTVSVRGLEGV